MQKTIHRIDDILYNKAVYFTNKYINFLLKEFQKDQKKSEKYITQSQLSLLLNISANRGYEGAFELINRQNQRIKRNLEKLGQKKAYSETPIVKYKKFWELIKEELSADSELYQSIEEATKELPEAKRQKARDQLFFTFIQRLVYSLDYRRSEVPKDLQDKRR